MVVTHWTWRCRYSSQYGIEHSGGLIGAVPDEGFTAWDFGITEAANVHRDSVTWLDTFNGSVVRLQPANASTASAW